MKTGTGVLTCWHCGRPMVVAWAGRHYILKCQWCGTENRVRRSKLEYFRQLPLGEPEDGHE